MVVERTLLVQLNAEPVDSAVRRLRDVVGNMLEERPLRGLVLNLAAVYVMDSYITRCVRDLAISARLMGVPTIVCSIQPLVADTLVEMGLDLGHVETALNIDKALQMLRAGRSALARD